MIYDYTYYRSHKNRYKQWVIPEDQIIEFEHGIDYKKLCEEALRGYTAKSVAHKKRKE